MSLNNSCCYPKVKGIIKKVGKWMFLAFSASCAEPDRTKLLETSSLWRHYIVLGFYFKILGIQMQIYIVNFTLSSQEFLNNISCQ